MKFLDRSTSSRGDLAHDPVILQGPDDQYPSWAEVEEHYTNETLKNAGLEEEAATVVTISRKQEKETEADLPLKNNGGAGNTLSQMLLDKLNFVKDPAATSPSSTPPLSPSSSGPVSSKTSPEVKSATMLNQDQTPVPPSLKPLLNPVVWYVHKKHSSADEDLIFLTNSADTMHLARDFGIPTKNIHQLRSTLGLAENEVQVQEPAKNEVSKRLSAPESKTLFSYDDVESDDEEVVFKPRGRGSTRGAQLSRGAVAGAVRGRTGTTRSPRNSFSTPTQPPAQGKPQIPVEEIDPDSFDRGSFARGSTPLINTSNHAPNQFNNGRAPMRGNYGRGGRGATSTRGFGNGFERGTTRGRGRLFVP